MICKEYEYNFMYSEICFFICEHLWQILRSFGAVNTNTRGSFFRTLIFPSTV